VGSSSGLIIAFVVVVWAAYFIPLALRRYDEASKNASVETTGSLSRVINRPRQKASTAQPVAAQPAAQVEQPVAEQLAANRPAPRSADRPAARRAAARRRRTLLTLVVLTAIVGGVAGFGVIAPFWVAAPVGLIVAWLVACRVQVRRENGVSGSGRVGSLVRRISLPRIPVPSLKRAGSAVAAAGSAATRSKAPRAKASRAKASRSSVATAADEEDTVIVSGQFEDIDPGRKHVMEDVALEADALDDKIVIAVPSVSTAGEALWDPLPVTLPTYVTKPRAGRTVRTIDFSQPHTWTSGHIEGEDVELPTRSDDTGEHRRAVGH
jgi:hypothetical protein